MIVCTCDVCGKETDTWITLNINFSSDSYRKDICPSCKITAKKALELYLDKNFIQRNSE